MRYFLPTASFIVATTALILSTAWPSLGPAWHQDTKWGEFLASEVAFYGLVTLGVSSIVSVFINALRDAKRNNAAQGKMRHSLVEITGLLAASLTVILIGVAPVPIFSVDETVLRSFDPEAALAPPSVSRFDLAEVSAPTESMEGFFGGKEQWRSFRMIEGELAVLQNRTPLGTAPDEETLNREKDILNQEIVTLNKVSCMRPMPRNLRLENNRLDHWDGELDEECLKRTFKELSLKRARVTEIEAILSAWNDADASERETQKLETKLTPLLREIKAREHVYIWSQTAVWAVTLLLTFASLTTNIAFYALVGVPTLVALGLYAPSLAVGPQFSTGSNLFAFAGLISAFGALIVAQVIRRFVSDNRETFRRYSCGERFISIAQALFFWLPLGFVVAGASMTSLFISNGIEDTAYQIEIAEEGGLQVDPNGCAKTPHLITNRKLDCSVRELEIDSQASTAYWFLTATEAMQREVSNLKIVAETSAEAAVVQVMDGFDQAIPFTLRTDDNGGQTGVSAAFNHPRCGAFWNIKCRFIRAIKYGLNDRYVTSRGSYRSKLKAKLTTAVASGKASGSSIEAIAQETIPPTMAALQAQVAQQIWASFRISDVLAALGTVIALIAILKSFGYILARVILIKSQDKTILSLAHRNGSVVNTGSVTVSDAQGLSLTEQGLYRVVLGTHVDDKAPHGLWPYQPSTLFLKRLFPLRHIFQHFVVTDTSDSATLPSGTVRRAIEIKLAEGDRIGFFPKYLAGIHGRPTLKARWTFDLAFLMMGRCRNCFAEGPGTIFLLSKDQPTVLGPDSKGGGINSARLMAWSDGLSLKSAQGLGWAAIYTSADFIKPSEDGMALFDGPTGRNRFGGAIGFVPMLLTPL